MYGKAQKKRVGGNFCFPWQHIARGVQDKRRTIHLFFSPVISTPNLFGYCYKACIVNGQKSVSCSSEHISKPAALQQRWVFALAVTGVVQQPGRRHQGVPWRPDQGRAGFPFFKVISIFRSLFYIMVVIRSILPLTIFFLVHLIFFFLNSLPF